MILLSLLLSLVYAEDCSTQKSLISKDTPINFIELFTSEGCSSCPPAESWLNSLKNRSGLYKEFIPLAFHVSYWDYIGHKDPLASSHHADRQRLYAANWGSKNVYTPEFVLNAKEWRDRSRKIPSLPKKVAGILKISKIDGKNDEFNVTYTEKGSYFLHYAMLAHDIKHIIRKGENRGKTLFHHFVVIDHQSKRFENNMTVKVNRKNPHSKNHDYVFWLEKSSRPGPVQAVAGCL